MNVLILPSWYPSHSGDISGCFFREQAIALRKKGLRVGVAAMTTHSLRRGLPPLTDGGFHFEDDQGVKTLRKRAISWIPRPRGVGSLLYQWQGRNLVDQYISRFGRPDLVHVHSSLNSGLLAVGAKQRHGIPFVVTEHSTAFARGLVSPSQLKRVKHIASNASELIGVSERFCELLVRKLSGEEGSWRYIPNIVSDHFLNQRIAINDKTHFRFLSVALLTEKKGMRDLLRAFARAFAGDESVSLDIGGDGEERSLLESLARELGVASQVRFLGRLSRESVARAMAMSDAFVSASHYETFGVVLIEALALGKPIVATACGGPESIVNHENGLLVAPKDFTALGEAMRQIYENRERYDPFALREDCRCRFSENAVTGQLMELYRSVVEETHARSS